MAIFYFRNISQLPSMKLYTVSKKSNVGYLARSLKIRLLGVAWTATYAFQCERDC